ncbi:MAG: NTP transferase domain-containing protein [Candidatus Baltobacteraceae bacterium]
MLRPKGPSSCIQQVVPMDDPVCVILAAGRSERMGFDKLARPLANGRTLLENALEACYGYPTVVVASRELSMQSALQNKNPIVNDSPERGMAHSAKLANAHIDGALSIAIIPADLPLLDGALLQTVFEYATGTDVCYPLRADGTPGHPVVFSPKARELFVNLPDGDTLRQVRNAKHLQRVTVPIEDERPYMDIDLPEQFR